MYQRSPEARVCQGSLFSHRAVALKVFRKQVVLNPLEPVGPQTLGEADDEVLVGLDAVAVEHQIPVGAEGLAGGGDYLFGFSDDAGVMGVGVGEADLGGSEAELLVPLNVGAGGVAEESIFGRATQDLVDGSVEQLALEVPYGEVHGADGVAREASGAVVDGGVDHHGP